MPINTESRRLAAILAADMVGYSRLMELDEADTLSRLKAIQAELIDPKVKEFGGRVVKTTGDGALIEFPSAVNAVLCAAAFQREMTDREVGISEERRIAYRIGINIGDIIINGDDIFGDGVNVASRLEGLAEPGGIRISEAVFNNVRGKLDLGFADLGPQKVKNLSQPVPTFQVLLDPDDVGKLVMPKAARPRLLLNAVLALIVLGVIAVGLYSRERFRAPDNMGEPKLLILPLTATNAVSRQVANAATENLIASFARLKGLTISPRDVSMRYKGIALVSGDVPEELGAHYLLDGAVTLQGDNVEVSVRLRDVGRSGEGVIWEQTEVGSADQLFGFLATLKQGTISAIKVTLNQTERLILEASPTTNIEAYLAFAEANRFLFFPKLKVALPLLERAIRLDPDFIDAQMAYAEANFQIWSKSYNTIRYSPDAFDVMQQTLARVVDEDPQNPYAIGLRIRIEIERLNREQALAEARAAVFLHQDNLDHPWPKFVLGLALFASGEYEAAKEQFVTYEQFSPRLNPEETRELARQYARLGEMQKALSLLERVPPEEANETGHFRILALAHSLNGDIEIAKLNVEKHLKGVPWTNLAWYRPQFDIYSDPKIFEDWAAALSAAGYPETPYDLAKIKKGDQLRHDELVEIFSERFVETLDKGPFGAPYREDRRANGTITMDYTWMNGTVFTGTWSIKGDQFCHRIAANHMGRENCNNVYIDRAKSTEDVKYVSNLWSYGIVHSVFTRVEQ
jgi:adenylate cyclase